MYVQSGTQRIEIIIRKDGGGTKGANETETDSVSSEGGENTGAGSSSAGKGLSAKKKRFLKVNITHGIGVVHQVADLAINYKVTGLGYSNGDQALQQQIERKVEIVTDVGNMATSIAMGAAYGSTGGPWGAAIGAVYGAIRSGSSLWAKYSKRERDYDFKVFKENNAIEYNRSRAMITETTGRLR